MEERQTVAGTSCRVLAVNTNYQPASATGGDDQPPCATGGEGVGGGGDEHATATAGAGEGGDDRAPSATGGEGIGGGGDEHATATAGAGEGGDDRAPSATGEGEGSGSQAAARSAVAQTQSGGGARNAGESRATTPSAPGQSPAAGEYQGMDWSDSTYWTTLDDDPMAAGEYPYVANGMDEE